MIGDTLDLRPEYDALAQALRAFAEARLPAGGRWVIGVGGESGSGKSITAVALARALESSGRRPAVLHQDDYFRRPPKTNHAFRQQDLAHVGSHEVRLDLLAEHIAAFRAGRSVDDAPLVDYAANAILQHALALDEADVLIVEGTYVSMLPDLDLRVFLLRTYRDTYLARMARARDAADPFVETVLEIEHRIIAPHAAYADVWVDAEYHLQRPDAS